MWIHAAQMSTDRDIKLRKNKSEEDIQRYKPDPYEYTLKDM